MKSFATAVLMLPLLGLAPGDSAFDRGVAALKAKDAPAAKAALNECIAAEPNRTECHWELGWAHFLLRDYASATAAWERVKSLDPDHPEVDKHLKQARAEVALQKSLSDDANAAPARIAAAPSKGSTLRLRAVGDMMLGTDFPAGYLPKDPASVIVGVKDIMADADVTFANLEGPLCDSGETKKCGKGGNCYAFRSPTSYGQLFKDAGVDLASTANNHSGDFQEECRTQTEQTLDKLGIAWSGRTGTVAHLEKNGFQIAMIAFHTGGGVNWVNDHETAKKIVAREAKTNDIVIVSFHGGAEGSKALHVPHEKEVFYGENRGELRKFTHAVVDAGADLVFGHGPHVPRAMEIYKDRLVAYSLGNFATYGRFTLKGALGLGMVLDVSVDNEGRFVAGKIISTKQIGKGVAVPDKKGAVLDYVRRLSKADFPKTGVIVAKDGSIGKR